MTDPLADAHALGAERWPGVVIDHDRSQRSSPHDAERAACSTV